MNCLLARIRLRWLDVLAVVAAGGVVFQLAGLSRYFASSGSWLLVSSPDKVVEATRLVRWIGSRTETWLGIALLSFVAGLTTRRLAVWPTRKASVSSIAYVSCGLIAAAEVACRFVPGAASVERLVVCALDVLAVLFVASCFHVGWTGKTRGIVWALFAGAALSTILRIETFAISAHQVYWRSTVAEFAAFCALAGMCVVLSDDVEQVDDSRSRSAGSKLAVLGFLVFSFASFFDASRWYVVGSSSELPRARECVAVKGPTFEQHELESPNSADLIRDRLELDARMHPNRGLAREVALIAQQEQRVASVSAFVGTGVADVVVFGELMARISLYTFPEEEIVVGACPSHRFRLVDLLAVESRSRPLWRDRIRD